MPRQESNNPTERIARLLEDFEEMKNYAEELLNHIAHYHPAELTQLPREPLSRWVLDEQLRRQYTLKTVYKTRRSTRLSRYRREQGWGPARGHTKYQPDMETQVTSTIDEAFTSEQLLREPDFSIPQPKEAFDSSIPPKVTIEAPDEGGGLSEDTKAALFQALREGKL